MNLILWIIIGGILGWIASLIMRTDAQQGVGLNIVVGIIGALVAGFVLTPLFGIATINQSNFSLPSTANTLYTGCLRNPCENSAYTCLFLLWLSTSLNVWPGWLFCTPAVAS